MNLSVPRLWRSLIGGGTRQINDTAGTNERVCVPCYDTTNVQIEGNEANRAAAGGLFTLLGGRTAIRAHPCRGGRGARHKSGTAVTGFSARRISRGVAERVSRRRAGRVGLSTMYAQILPFFRRFRRVSTFMSRTLDERPATAGAASYGAGDGTSWHHPFEASQNRRSGASHRSQGLGPHGHQLSFAGPIRSGPPAPQTVTLRPHQGGHRYLTTPPPVPIEIPSVCLLASTLSGSVLCSEESPRRSPKKQHADSP